MTKTRASLALDISEFKPAPRMNPVPVAELTAMAEEAGFVTRHAPKTEPVAPVTKEPARAKPVKLIDGRKLRKTKRTAQLNIAVSPEDKNRFWTLFEALEMDSGGEVLAYLLDLAEQNGEGA